MDMQEIKIRAVVFQASGWWVAQCLEYDIAAQAHTIKGLAYELQRTLVGHVVVSIKEGLKPFANLPKAPESFEKMFAEGMRFAPQHLTIDTPTDMPSVVPELSLAA